MKGAHANPVSYGQKKNGTGQLHELSNVKLRNKMAHPHRPENGLEAE